MKDHNKLKIVEGAESIWHYHLSESGLNGKPAICGNKQVMHTDIPLSCWGKKAEHISETFCKECTKLLKESKCTTKSSHG
jgi:hypothetical protein